MAKYTLPDLPYDYAALEPHISATIMELHHDKHHQAYVTGANTALEQLAEARDSGNLANVNKLEKDLAFNLGGHTNHSIFWTNLSPDGGDKPDGRAARPRSTTTSARSTSSRPTSPPPRLGVQGSGWAGLFWDSIGENLIIQQFFDQQSQFARGHRAAAPARRVGARVLPRLQERPRRLRQGVLEHRELAERRRTASRSPVRRPQACWYCHSKCGRPGGTARRDAVVHRLNRTNRAFAHDTSQEKFRDCQDRNQRLRPHRTQLPPRGSRAGCGPRNRGGERPHRQQDARPPAQVRLGRRPAQPRTSRTTATRSPSAARPSRSSKSATPRTSPGASSASTSSSSRPDASPRPRTPRSTSPAAPRRSSSPLPPPATTRRSSWA